MNRLNINRYVKLWESITRKQREVDEMTMKFAKDLRAEFRAGDVGDAEFEGWLRKHLHLAPEKIQTLIAMAAVASVGDDVKRIGGAKAVRSIANRFDGNRFVPRAPAEIRKIAETAVKENRHLTSAARVVDNGGKPPEPRRVVDHYSNARALALHLASTGKVPVKLRDVVHHYVPPQPTPVRVRMPSKRATT